MKDLAPWRLNLLRAGYLLLVLGLGPIVWPEILHEMAPNERAVVAAMLGALTLLSLIGLRHPLRMLPVLFFEITWKVIWLLALALPLWSAGRMDPATAWRAVECLVVAVHVAVIPWDHVLATYVKAPGDPWRRRR